MGPILVVLFAVNNYVAAREGRRGYHIREDEHLRGPRIPLNLARTEPHPSTKEPERAVDGAAHAKKLEHLARRGAEEDAMYSWWCDGQKAKGLETVVCLNHEMRALAKKVKAAAAAAEGGDEALAAELKRLRTAVRDERKELHRKRVEMTGDAGLASLDEESRLHEDYCGEGGPGRDTELCDTWRTRKGRRNKMEARTASALR